MAFPELVPTSRSFESGDYPIKTYKAQNGAETRILYGSNRTNMKLSLSYTNITDANAELFLDHYDEMKGTFTTFGISRDFTKKGWEGNRDAIGAEISGNSYRYEGPPQMTQVRPGISTVTVNLIGIIDSV
tara:strand:+ start:692 stop:1081 length:390 start_codon:yes stop_codon:yes gene_type:complete